MESKLPKPSGLKRPMLTSKTILPTDRIKAAAITGFGSKATNTLIANNLTTFAPLSRDITNITNGMKNRERAASPEMDRRISTHHRAKLRRSRSACDIRDMRDMRPLKRIQTTLAPIPAKTLKLPISCSSLTNTFSHSAGIPKPARTVTAITSIIKRPVLNVRSASNKSVTTSTATKKSATTSSNSTSLSTTGAGKPINKRIPPYDFKARYNDLLEKYKVLKEKFDDKCEQMGNLENLPEQLEDTQSQLITTKEQLTNAQTQTECLQKQVSSQLLKIDTITNRLTTTKEELEQLQQSYNDIKKEHTALNTEVIELRERTAVLTEENALMQEELETCKDQLFRSNLERKELHNTVMDLRGNIRVFCRVRPPLSCEQEKLVCGWNYIDEATVEIQNLTGVGANKQGSHVFSFDQVFHPKSSQEEIFEMVSPLIQSALDGYNICIFAYGQTGSGKTYTMDGVATNVGVIPRTVDLLFDSIKNYKRLGWEYEIKVTFLEIYNEVLYDLLSNDQKEMEIRMAKNNKNDIYVSNITEETVGCANRLRQLMEIAKMNRATASTIGNERSSRSHAVTKLELIGKHAEKQEVSVGTINLVDLAGSESPKTSTRMMETKSINRSLSELTNVILALLQKQDHIPYRNSKLTHLLMPSLGGNSKTLMFINVAPFQDCFVESVKSLRFAATVNSCKMVKAKRNRFLNTSCNSSGSFDK